MDKQLIFIVQGNRMSVSTDTAGSCPLRSLCVIDLDHIDDLLRLVWSSTNNNQFATHECYQVLISSNGCICLWFWWCNPIPATISVFSQSPHVIQCTSIWISLRTFLVFFCLSSSSINYHHSLSWTLFTDSCAMVDSGCRAYFVLKFVFLPLERTFIDIQ